MGAMQLMGTGSSLYSGRAVLPVSCLLHWVAAISRTAFFCLICVPQPVCELLLLCPLLLLPRAYLGTCHGAGCTGVRWGCKRAIRHLWPRTACHNEASAETRAATLYSMHGSDVEGTAQVRRAVKGPARPQDSADASPQRHVATAVNNAHTCLRSGAIARHSRCPLPCNMSAPQPSCTLDNAAANLCCWEPATPTRGPCLHSSRGLPCSWTCSPSLFLLHSSSAPMALLPLHLRPWGS